MRSGAIAALAWLFITATSSYAANKTWTGLDPVAPTDFEKPLNWSGGVPGNSTLTDIGVFNFNTAPNNTTPNLTIDRAINGLDFESGGFTLGSVGRILTIGRPTGTTPMIESVGAGTNTISVWASVGSGSVGTIDVGSSNTLIMAGKLTGTFAKTGLGTLRLSTNNDPALAQGLSGFKVNGGVVELNGSIHDFLSVISFPLVINNGGTLRWLADEQMVNSSGHIVTLMKGGLADLNGHTETSGGVFFHDGGTFSTGTGVFFPIQSTPVEFFHDPAATSTTAIMTGRFNTGSSSTATWTVDRGTAAVDLQINSTIEGPGSFLYAGNSNFTNSLDPSGGILLLNNANNSYTGGTTVRLGTLLLGGNAPAGAANGILGNNTSAVQMNNNGGTAALMTNGAFTVGRPITCNFGSGTNFIGGETAESSTYSGTITFNDTNNRAKVTAVSGGTVTFSNNIAGAGQIEKAGVGVVRFTHANNTYTNTTTITAGKLIVTADGALGTSAGTTTVSSGGALGFDGGVAYNTLEPVTINGTGPAGAGAIENITGANSFAGPITLGSDSLIGASAGSLTLTGTINTNGKALTFVGAVNTSSAPISGSGSFNKSGSDTSNVTTANTYSGGTTINQGKLLVNNTSGSGTGSGSVNIENTGALGGKGFIDGPVFASSGGTISPGNSPGDLTVNNDVTLVPGSNFVVEAGGTNGTFTPGVDFDVLTINGNGKTFHIGGSNLVAIPIDGVVTGHTYHIVDTENGAVVDFSNFFANLTNGQLFDTGADVSYTVTATSSGVDLTFSSVPEPAMIVWLVAPLLLLRQRRGWRMG